MRRRPCVQLFATFINHIDGIFLPGFVEIWSQVFVLHESFDFLWQAFQSFQSGQPQVFVLKRREIGFGFEFGFDLFQILSLMSDCSLNMWKAAIRIWSQSKILPCGKMSPDDLLSTHLERCLNTIINSSQPGQIHNVSLLIKTSEREFQGNVSAL